MSIPLCLVGTVILHDKYAELISRIACLERWRIIHTQGYLLMMVTNIPIGVGKHITRDVHNILCHHKASRYHNLLRIIIDNVKLIVTAYLWAA